MSDEIFNPELVKNEYLNNVLPVYAQSYSQFQIDLSVYLLNDFVNYLVENNVVLLRVEQEPEPVVQQVPVPPSVNPRMVQRQDMNPVYVAHNPDPFASAEQQVNPSTQRMRVEDEGVRREVEEMNAQLNRSVGQQPTQGKQDINLQSEKSKSFVDKIRDMRRPKKKDGINPEDA